MNVRIILSAAIMAWTLGLPAPALAQDWIVKFRPGDTLWDLCIKYSNKRGCWIELGKYNNVSDDRTILPGEEIRFPKAWLTTLPVVGQVEDVSGDVLYEENSRVAGIPLVVGQSLILGSRIVTGQGSAQITLGNNSAALIRPDSELNLDSFSTGPGTGQTTELSLDAGDVEVEVKPESKSRFQIKTPAAIAAVRGTRYRVSSLSGGSASTRSEVLAGAVEVSGVGATLVPAGFGLLARQGQAPGNIKKLLPPPVFQHKREDVPLPVVVQWEAHPEAVSWKLDLRLGEEGGDLAATYVLTEPQIALTGLSEASCYQLVLRGVDAAGFNGMESQLPLCVVAKLSAPTDISIDRLEETPARYRVAWSAVAGARQYRLEVATDREFDSLISSHEVTQPSADIVIADVDRFSVRVTAIDEYANMSAPSQTAGHVQPNYLIPASVMAVFLLIALL